MAKTEAKTNISHSEWGDNSSTNRQADRRTDRQMDRQLNTQTGRCAKCG